MSDAGAGAGGVSGAQRRRTQTVSTIAALLVLGGGAAVGLGVLNQDPSPTTPSQAAGGAQPSRPDRPAAGPRPVASPGDAGRSGPRHGGDTGLRPVRIAIPAIDVDSPMTTVGLQANGTLAVPQPGPGYDKAAWFKDSPAPGEAGPAVIEGHVDGKRNGPSVFYRLGALKPGNSVMVTRDNGTSVRFTVDAVQLFAKDAFPTLKVYGNTSRPELRLITCGGTFDRNRRKGGYRSNVVVFAHRA